MCSLNIIIIIALFSYGMYRLSKNKDDKLGLLLTIWGSIHITYLLCKPDEGALFYGNVEKMEDSKPINQDINDSFFKYNVQPI
jgi:hypothetical protein